MISAKALLRFLVHGRSDEAPKTRARVTLRWVRIAVLIITALVTLQSVLLVAGAWGNDLAIRRNMGVAQAEVLSAGPRRSTIEFVTPERVTYRPELGVLYPSQLATGMRIYVEYNKNDPNLVRVQHRNARRVDRRGELAGRNGRTDRAGRAGQAPGPPHEGRK